jgi:hypothetical protein
MRRLGGRTFAYLLVSVFGFAPCAGQSPSILDAVRILDPALQVSVAAHIPTSACIGSSPWFCDSTYYNGDKLAIGVDAAGNHYSLTSARILQETNQDTYYFSLQRLDTAGVMTDIAYLYSRRCRNAPIQCTYQDIFEYRLTPLLDVTNGRILIGLRVTYIGSGEQDNGMVAISGLPTLFDTLLTFVPSGQALKAVMPAHPDGFRSADSVQIWVGDVRTLPDWSLAEPLSCAAAMNPSPYQVVTVPDTLPEPPVGHGRYYLTADVSGPDRRLGRQYVDDAFSARDPSTLPICQ